MPPAIRPQQPITAADWNDFVYSVGFHTRPPAALLLQNLYQSVTSATTTKAILDSAVRDSDAGHDPTANSSRYTVQVPGLYQVMVIGYVPGNAAAGNERYLAIIVNNTAIWSMQVANTSFWGTCGMDIPLNTGDYIEIQTWQDSGAAANTQAGPNNLSLQMLVVWVGK